MRHLKKFEGLFDRFFKKREGEYDWIDKLSKDQILFERVPENSRIQGERMEFSKREIDYLKTLNRISIKNPIKDYDEKMDGELKFRNIDTLPGGSLTWYELENESKTKLFYIYKYDDHWYRVVCREEIDDNKYNMIPYKCDTFEGVKQLLRFKRIFAK